MQTAEQLIDRLALAPHPEGGWYRETWRGPDGGDGRALGTTIHYLLERGQRSHWHRIDASELWLWQGGDPMQLSISAENMAPTEVLILGPATSKNAQLQGLVQPHAWQSAQPFCSDAGYSLVSCVVVPGFDFAQFEIAPDGWSPEKARSERD